MGNDPWTGLNVEVQHLAWPKELAMTTPPEHPIGPQSRTAAGCIFDWNRNCMRLFDLVIAAHVGRDDAIIQ